MIYVKMAKSKGLPGDEALKFVQDYLKSESVITRIERERLRIEHTSVFSRSHFHSAFLLIHVHARCMSIRYRSIRTVFRDRQKEVRRQKMKRLMAAVLKGDMILYSIAGAVLAFMIVLTLCDVILRNLGHPITGSMEIIQYGGSIVFGFSIPYATWIGAQVLVDLVTQKLSPKKPKKDQGRHQDRRHPPVPVRRLQFLRVRPGCETDGRADGEFQDPLLSLLFCHFTQFSVPEPHHIL